MQGFSNFFIPNLATVHLQARGHSPPLTATRPCGRLRVAAPQQAAYAACLHLMWAGAGPSGCLPSVAAPQQRHHRPPAPARAAALPYVAASLQARPPRLLPMPPPLPARPRRRSLRGRAAGPPCRPPSLSQRASCSRSLPFLPPMPIALRHNLAPPPPVRAPPIWSGLALAARALRALAARARGTEKLDRWGWVGWRGGPDWFGFAGWVG